MSVMSYHNLRLAIMLFFLLFCSLDHQLVFLLPCSVPNVLAKPMWLNSDFDPYSSAV